MRHFERAGLYWILGITFCGAAFGYQALSKEYIRINGRVIAIENSGASTYLDVDPRAEAVANQEILIQAKAIVGGAPVPVTWEDPLSGDGTWADTGSTS